jgi:UTP--glucose-1-phosphate uridylyltransferase
MVMGISNMKHAKSAEALARAVIPAAGLGTRLLSATKEQPKEMLPLFATSEHNTLCLKPIVQLIFEQLFDFGIREFYFIVGRGKRALEDHFTVDRDFINRLSVNGRSVQGLDNFYDRIERSTIVWVNQPVPKGFGDAVRQTRRLIGDNPFLVHAGDTYILSKQESIFSRMLDVYTKAEAGVTLTVKEIADPRQYGVAEAHEHEGHLDVERVEEKPRKPRTNLAMMPLYIFDHGIFEAIENIPPDKSGEIQLTDAIQHMIVTGHRVKAVKLLPDDIRLDVGTPETYWYALEESHKHANLSKMNLSP